MKLRLLFAITTLLTTCILLEQVLAHSAGKSCPAPPSPTIPSPRSNRYSSSSRHPPNQRYTPLDMILATSLDGSICGIGRYDGRVYWTARGGYQASLVKSNANYRSRLVPDLLRQNSKPSSNLPDLSDKVIDDDDDDSNNNNDDPYYTTNNNNAPLLDNSIGLLNEKAGGLLWNGPQNYNVTYIIEPVDGGSLYLHIDGESIQKLPFSMKDIVDRSFITEDGVIYMGEKSTMMIALDPISGNILRKFDFYDSEYDFMAASSHLPPSNTVYLARNEYKVRISDPKKNMYWRFTYSEYEPNALNWDVPKHMGESDPYIAPYANQDITAINRTTGKINWTRELPYQVVSVFDVYRTPDSSLILSRQTPPAQLHKPFGDLIKQLNPHQQDTAYVGIHGGTLYALSSRNFPLVQIAQESFIKSKQMPGARLIDSGYAEFDKQSDRTEYKADRLIGRNSVDSLLLPPPSFYPSPREPIDDSPNYYDQRNITDNYTLNLPFGISEYWQLYTISLLTLVFMNYGRTWRFCVRHILPFVIRRIINIDTNNVSANGSNTTMVHDNSAESTKAATTPNAIVDDNNLSLPDHPSSNTSSITFDKNEQIKDNSKTSSHTVMSSLKATGMDLQDFQPTKSSVLDISETVLGYGSHGTVVYKGVFDGRAVAVKRLLIDFYDVAYQEVKLLQESDDHPNVIRYFYKEESDRFLYIALELCFGSLQDCMDRSLSISDMKLYDQIDPANTLYQITSGIQHLHSLKIVHRDLKPQNILLAPTKHRTSNDSPAIRILISDFGLCKKLDGEQSSFHYTAASPAGTSGWRAPELLAGALAASASASDHTSFSNSSNGNSSSSDPNRIGRVKATRAIDIFSAGCIFYYVLSNGDHPFGNRFGRENNILKGDYDISKLEDMGEDGMEAMDLIDSMINTNPRSRPTADKVLRHPFFWSTSKRLSFLQDASDRFEVEQRDPPSALLQCLEKDAKKIVGYDWYRRIDRVVVNDLGKFRKYDGKRVRDLLRALRNKKHHWQDLPEPVKRTLGEPPDQYLYYFTARFPRLLLHTYHIIGNNDALTHEGALRQYF